MRFPAAQPQKPTRNVPAPERVQPPVAEQLLPEQAPAPVRPDELPAALDERLRLVGEW
jgi:hypothetical protein